MTSRKIIDLIQKLFGMCGVGITSKATLNHLIKTEEEYFAMQDRYAIDLHLALSIKDAPSEKMLPLIASSESQLHQDIFVLSILDFKKDGYFVEFGAASGRELSNSYLLEKEFNWRGILAEPGKIWHQQLKANRENAIIETRCVWKDSDSTLTFNEVKSAELSTIQEFSGSDGHIHARAGGVTYSVETISLLDLLDSHNAPRVIDYLSIDTEGSEYEILEAFDFAKYSFNVITCEHNYTSNREKIYSLLTAHGYVRVHDQLSQFDDWYINADLIPAS